MTQADAFAFDHLAADGFDAGQAESLDGDTRARCDAAVSLLSLLDAYPAEPLTDEQQQTLVDATMARIRRAEDDRRDRMRLDNQPVMLGRGLRFRIAEGLAVAAVLAMATATLWSFGTSARTGAISAGTHRNLGELHAGLSGFQDANDQAVPLRDASRPINRLLGSRDAQLIDLYLVATEGYCDEDCLRNPRRPTAGKAGFSFAALPTAEQGPLWHADMVLVGDRNPALAGMLAGQSYDEALSGSTLHARLQNRPSALFSDGHIEDLDTAAHDGDGIWRIDPAAGPAPIELFRAHR